MVYFKRKGYSEFVSKEILIEIIEYTASFIDIH